ncbi:MAG: TenA family protein [Chloroflexi bacterium]|nr:TenA family protein [Chloroflexota bacterium]
MTNLAELKTAHAGLWEAATHHRFIEELGDGSLPIEKFRRYLIQDYVFVNDLSKVLGIAEAKAPDIAAARPMAEFQSALMGAEDALFLRAFESLGIAQNEWRTATPLPTTAAFGDFLVRTAYEGGFEEVCAAFAVTEGVYMDWGQRLADSGAEPANEFYREWIVLHTEKSLGPFVRFVDGVVDDAPAAAVSRLSTVFERALRYEIKFWDMAYSGESW